MTPERTKRAKPGDVVLIGVDDGWAYLQYIGDHKRYGDAIVVGPKVQSRASVVGADLLKGGYITFYPLKAAALRGFVEIVGWAPPPEMPGRLRREGHRVGRRVKSWLIDGDRTPRVAGSLTDEELRLPIAGIWNHEFLVHRSRGAWRPEFEGNDEEAPSAERPDSSGSAAAEPSPILTNDARAVSLLKAAAPASHETVVAHYSYFGAPGAARQMAARAKDAGFETEMRRGETGAWLVLARQRLVPSEEAIAAARQWLEELVRQLGGEYDGWQGAVGGAPVEGE